MEMFIVLLPYLPIAVAVIALLIFFLVCVKTVSGNEILVVTGIFATKKIVRKVKVIRDGREVEEEQISYVPKIKIAGACIVIPFIQKARKFDICVETYAKAADTIKTVKGIEIDIDWGISYAPNAETVDAVLPAIRQFLDKSKDETQHIISNVVAGGVRAVVSTMDPVQVMTGKDTLDDAVQKSIVGQMADLGYKVQLYIQEVRDAKNSTYLHDFAADARETTRKNAANITAENNQVIREKQATSERIAKQAELDSEQAIRERKAMADQLATQAELQAQLQIAEKTRDAEVGKAQFKAETDRATADATIAGEIRLAERKKELATNAGQIKVEEQVQANLAAEKTQGIAKTEAETQKIQKTIEAEAEAEKAKIAAEGAARAAEAEAKGKAEAVKLEAAAAAERIEKTGAAEATATQAKGLAEAEAIRAKGLAEAAAEKALAEARAANDKVNFEIARLEIEQKARVEIARAGATIMAEVGKNAKFVDFGGNGGSGTGNVLTDVLSSLPRLLEQVDIANRAVTDGEKPFADTIRDTISAIVDPLSVLNKETKVIVPAAPTDTPLPDPDPTEE